MFKKGDLTINIVIVAIIALIVLVVLLAVFGGKIGLFVEKTNDVQSQSCEGTNGGQVIAMNDNCPAGLQPVYSQYDDVAMGYKCCLPSKAGN